jgi:tRNA(Ile)-lysidine synthase
VRYLVAVSGGIDSVVLLDMLVTDRRHELIVAHFDHGIRPDSAEDARFVEGLAKLYNLPFVTKREELGSAASEDLARSKRYAFLNEEATKHNAIIATAHHSDDVIETIAINLSRGTGWRGVAALGNMSIARPLLDLTKSDIRKYAGAKRLEWAEDSTNNSDAYLRNRLRQRIATSLSEKTKKELLVIWERQLILKKEIYKEEDTLIQVGQDQSRYILINSDSRTAEELLRRMIMKKAGVACTRPQASRALLAVKTGKPGTIFEIGARCRLHFKVQTFTIQNT